MRNAILLCIALIIAAGVLAKNPPAAAPSLAAVLASLPAKPEAGPAPVAQSAASAVEQATVAKAQTAKPPSESALPQYETASYSVPETAHAPNETVPANFSAATEPAPEPVVFEEIPVAVKPEAIKSKAVEPKERAPAKQIVNSAVAAKQKAAAPEKIAALPLPAAVKKQDVARKDPVRNVAGQTTVAVRAKVAEPVERPVVLPQTLVARNEPVRSAPVMPSVPTKTSIRESIRSSAATLPLGLAVSPVSENAGLPTEPILKRTVRQLRASAKRPARSPHNVEEAPRSLNEMLDRTITRAADQPVLPVSPLAESKNTARTEVRRKERVADPARPAAAENEASAILPPMFAGSKTIRADAREKERETAVTDESEPVAIMPPMFVNADINRPAPPATAELRRPAAFAINITPDPGTVRNSNIDRPADPVGNVSPKAANAAPARFQLNLQDGGYCDPSFVGPTLTFAQTAELTLDDLLYQIHNRFGVNFIMGPNIGSLPVNIKAGSVPWNRLLRSQLFVSGVRAKCLDQNTVELVETKALSGLQDTADVNTRFVKLKFLQRTGSGSVDLAGRSQGGQGGAGQGGGCGSSGGQSGAAGSGGQTGETAAQQTNNKFDKLIIEIEKILGIRSMTESSVGGGGGGGQTAAAQAEERRTNRFVTQIPGRNILAIRATDEEHALIDQIIERADRPPFQVVIKGLVYTANQDKLRDIGVQTTITEPLRRNSQDRAGGGVFGHTIGAGGTLFDFSTIIGTFDFNVQATALQQNGVLSVKSRPFSTVLDGLCTRLNVGRSIPIVIDSTLGGQGSLEFVEALNKLEVTPHVIDDDEGNPMAVTLELVMFANEVDASVTTLGVPAVNERSIQTQLLLTEDKTAILGGFTLDSDQRSVSKTPGLGDIPIIGELFKRRVKTSLVNRLYFAISVSVIPYGDAIRPVDVPGATTEPPSITPEMKQRGDKAEPKQVKGP